MDKGLKLTVPQADDVEKILDFPLAIANGANTRTRIAERYHFDERQADYYIEAMEMLGLVKRRGGVCILTSRGQQYCVMDPTQQKLTMVRKMLILPIITLVLAEMFSDSHHSISRGEIEKLIEQNSKIHKSTIPRRAQCIMIWLRWIGDQTNTISGETEHIELSFATPTSQ
ncbi:MAG TPA: AAA-associated domain-containing protein [Nitrososphaerales archaeon]|nr:AAA-associated domain-containing protein [Nitrososphaerales archaeon]